MLTLIKFDLLENLQVPESAQNLEILTKVVNIFFLERSRFDMATIALIITTIPGGGLPGHAKTSINLISLSVGLDQFHIFPL